MKKLWTALLSAILCCSLAFGAVSVCAETGGDTNVVPVLTTEITQADWDSAEKYEMTAVSEGTSGATGTVSFLATGTRLYFLMQVQDATKFDSDRPDYTITIGGKTASARVSPITQSGNLSALRAKIADAILPYSEAARDSPYSSGTLCGAGSNFPPRTTGRTGSR